MSRVLPFPEPPPSPEQRLCREMARLDRDYAEERRRVWILVLGVPLFGLLLVSLLLAGRPAEVVLAAVVVLLAYCR